MDLFDWELDITEWMQDISLGPARFLRGWVFWMGVKGVAGGVLLAVVGLFWVRHLRLGAVFLVLIGVPDVFNLWLREIIARPRPSVETHMVEVLGGPQGFSFPSGTTLHMLLFYGFLLYLAGRYISSRRLVYTLWAMGTLYILTSGVWVIYDGRHWFMDATGGYLYGGFYLLVWVVAYRWAQAWIREGRALQFSSRFPRFLRKRVEWALQLIE